PPRPGCHAHERGPPDRRTGRVRAGGWLHADRAAGAAAAGARRRAHAPGLGAGPGPLSIALFAYYLAVMAATLGPLRAARRRSLPAATLVMLVAPLTNFAAFILLRVRLVTLELPPLLLPASVVFVALLWFATRESPT